MEIGCPGIAVPLRLVVSDLLVRLIWDIRIALAARSVSLWGTGLLRIIRNTWGFRIA